MLEYLTKLKIDKTLRVNYSTEFQDKKELDFKNISLDLFLVKYYSILDNFDEEVWEKIMLNLIELAYDETKYQLMAENFGYSSIENHDFSKQYEFYNILKKDGRLDDELRKFIGFMAGNHFFDKYVHTIDDWFNSYNWDKPYLPSVDRDEEKAYTINDILDLPYGINYLKSLLPRLNYWRR